MSSRSCYEEVWRGELADAVGHAASTEPRGEHVIVLAPAPEPPAASDDEIDAHVQAALAEGLSTRDAAARVAARPAACRGAAPTTPRPVCAPRAKRASTNRVGRHAAARST